MLQPKDPVCRLHELATSSNHGDAFLTVPVLRFPHPALEVMFEDVGQWTPILKKRATLKIISRNIFMGKFIIFISLCENCNDQVTKCTVNCFHVIFFNGDQNYCMPHCVEISGFYCH